MLNDKKKIAIASVLVTSLIALSSLYLFSGDSNTDNEYKNDVMTSTQQNNPVSQTGEATGIDKEILERAKKLAAEEILQKERSALPAPEMPEVKKDFGRLTGFQVTVPSALDEEERIARKREINQIARAWPEDKKSCSELPGFNPDPKAYEHMKNVHQILCERAGAERYFKCAPTGVVWDMTIEGCEEHK